MAEERDKTEIEFDRQQDELYRINFGDYKNQPVRYSLDHVSPTEIEDEGFMDQFRFFSNAKDDAMDGIFLIINLIFFDMPFHSMVALTHIMLWLLDFAYETNIVNSMVVSIEETVTSIAGISGGTFGNSGLFGAFIGLVSIAIGIAALYQFIVKRAAIGAFGSLLKSLLALTFALVFFSNYSAIVTGMNTISIEASGYIVGATDGGEMDEEGGFSNLSAIDNMTDNVFNTFIHQPYLQLQYGTMDEEEIGRGRIESLLLARPGSQDRQDIAIDEVVKHGNDMMTRGVIVERMTTLGIIMFGNFINSIPVSILSLALFFFQFWFIVIAMIAPFVLLWGALPGQFGVVTRYVVELMIPLALKMAVSVIAVLIFGLTSILTSLNLGSGLLNVIMTMVTQAILLMTMFMLRKRILNVFSKGSALVSTIREESKSAFADPAHNVGTLAGATVGGIAGGAQGAMVGAGIGGSTAKLATGEQDGADYARNTAMSMYMTDRMMKGKQSEKNQTKEKEKNAEREQLSKEANDNQEMNQRENNTKNAPVTGSQIPTFSEESGADTTTMNSDLGDSNSTIDTNDDPQNEFETDSLNEYSNSEGASSIDDHEPPDLDHSQGYEDPRTAETDHEPKVNEKRSSERQAEYQNKQQQQDIVEDSIDSPPHQSGPEYHSNQGRQEMDDHDMEGNDFQSVEQPQQKISDESLFDHDLVSLEETMKDYHSHNDSQDENRVSFDSLSETLESLAKDESKSSNE